MWVFIHYLRVERVAINLWIIGKSLLNQIGGAWTLLYFALEFHLDIVILENIVLTYVHASAGSKTKQFLCLVASNKMSLWPFAWISSAPTGCHVVKLDISVIVEKSVACYIEPKILDTLQKGEGRYTYFVQQYKMFCSLTLMHWKPVAFLTVLIVHSDVAQQYNEDLFIGSMRQNSLIETWENTASTIVGLGNGCLKISLAMYVVQNHVSGACNFSSLLSYGSLFWIFLIRLRPPPRFVIMLASLPTDHCLPLLVFTSKTRCRHVLLRKKTG